MIGLPWEQHVADVRFGPLMTLMGFRFGLLTIYANHDQSVNQLLPPLTIERGEVDEVLDALNGMLNWVEMNALQ